MVMVNSDNGAIVPELVNRVAKVYNSQTKFFTTVIDAKLEFIKEATGKVISAILYQNGQQHEAKKIK